MKRFVRYTLALALLGAPVTSAAQSAPAVAPPPAGGPLEMLTAYRAELNLSAEQEARLRGIFAQLEARNAPLRERLRAERQHFVRARRAQLRRLTPQQRRDTLRALRQRRRMPAIPTTMRPLIEQMRANQRAAAEQARQVLTPAQQRKARELLRQRRAQQRQAGWRHAGPGGQRP